MYEKGKVEALTSNGRNVSRGWTGRAYCKRMRAKAVRRCFKQKGEEADTECLKGWCD